MNLEPLILQIADEAGNKVEAFRLLKDALELIHAEISEEAQEKKKRNNPEGSPVDHPALRYVLCKVST